jgi:nucleotide-binding universal stress UspA family protein
VFRRILVPLDRPAPDHPLLLATRAWFPGAQLHLLHVLVPFDGTVAEALRYAAMPETDHAQAQLSQVQRELEATGPGDVVVSAQPAVELLRRARRDRFDLVVLGTSTKSFMEKRVLGSVAAAAVRHSAVPVLTLVHGAPVPAPPRRILALQDFSDEAQRAVHLARTQFPEAAVEQLHVLPHGTATGFRSPRSAPYSLLPLRRQRRLMESRRRLEALGGGVLLEGDPAGVALARAAAMRAELIVMGRSAKGIWEGLFFGSVAGQMVTLSPIPVLSTRRR